MQMVISVMLELPGKNELNMLIVLDLAERASW
jgi:hypothetical protein